MSTNISFNPVHKICLEIKLGRKFFLGTGEKEGKPLCRREEGTVPELPNVGLELLTEAAVQQLQLLAALQQFLHNKVWSA
jgi:hypothetical protein